MSARRCTRLLFVVQVLLFADISQARDGTAPLAFDAPVGSPALGTHLPPEASPHDDAPPAPPPAPAPPPVVRHAAPEPSPWKFGYHGYLRAPMRFGFGARRDSDYPPGYDVSGTRTTIHEATVPDDQYLSFQSTSHNPRSWAEAFFSFGNAFATGTLGLGSYNLTEGGFNDYEANWGISQAYVTLTPDLPWENLRGWAKAGAIVDRYGMAGRYDAGEYDTYMFGRTHVMGETTHLEYDLTPAWTLTFEQGFGSKKPDPNIYNNARYTMLHHEHLSLKQGRDLELGAHYLMSWSQEEYRVTDGQAPGTDDRAPRNGLPPGHLWVTGVEARAELGAFGYLYGAYSHVGADWAVTVSRALETLSFSGGGEYDFGVSGNYLDSPNCAHALNPNNPTLPARPTPPQNWTALHPRGCSDGNGRIDALQAHYEFSYTNFRSQITGGPRFWGQGFDAILKLYALAAFVHSDARDTTKAPRDVGQNNSAFYAASPPGYAVTKLKLGADLAVQALPWLTPAVRFDRVMPNDHLPAENFSILSPRLSFKSRWVTHERITLGYSHYFYDQRECPPATVPLPGSATLGENPDPLSPWRCTRPPPSPVPYDGFGSTPGKQRHETRSSGVTRPDEDVFKIEATMWW